MVNGVMKEAQEGRVEWPDVDEDAFLCLMQWMYSENYTVVEPDIPHDHSNLSTTSDAGVQSATAQWECDELPLSGLDLSITHLATTTPVPKAVVSYCCNSPLITCINCPVAFSTFYAALHMQRCNKCLEMITPNTWPSTFQQCTRCHKPHEAICSECEMGRAECPTCNDVTPCQRVTGSCSQCDQAFRQFCCDNCRTAFPQQCRNCSEPPVVVKEHGPKKVALIESFQDESGTIYPSPTTTFTARKNIHSCEDYTKVLLCHAKLYVLGDMYIIPALKQLALHRLHATLKTFTLYPRRVQDITTLARYIFENTMPEDEIRDMISLYFACIVEDLVELEGMEELLEEVPGFAVGLVKHMSKRLA